MTGPGAVTRPAGADDGPGPGPLPWERQETDTDRSFEAFREYLQMGPGRSQAKVAELVGKNVSLISRWAKAHRWAQRAQAFDADADSRIAERMMATRWAMAERHVQLAQSAQLLVARGLQSTLKQASQVELRDLTRLFKVATDVERSAFFPRGDGTDVEVSAHATIVIDQRLIPPPTLRPPGVGGGTVDAAAS